MKAAVGMLLVAMAVACAAKDPFAAPPDVAAPPSDALRTPSGLASKVLRVGLGTGRPSPRQRVLINYTGWTADGKMFETTLGRQPVTVAVDQVIPGWTEGLQLMVPGEKRRFWLPANLGQ